MKALFALLIISITIISMRDPFDSKDIYSEIPKGSEEMSVILPHLNQKFYYLGEGSQIIAFVSEDQSIVLKLFKKTHKKRFKLSRLIREGLKDRHQSRKKWTIKFQNTCRRYKMAFTELKEDTGLIGLHFYQTKDPLIVILKSKKTHRVDLSKHPFILQKKAVIAPEYAKVNTHQAHLALKKLFKRRLDKGFSDPRQTLTTNYGFIGDRAIQLDVGKIEQFEGDKEQELSKIYARLEMWINGIKSGTI